MEGVQAQRDFVDKLIAALDHPEPETRAPEPAQNAG